MQRMLALALLLLASCAAAETRQPVIELWPGGAPETQTEPTRRVITERGDPDHLRDRFASRIAAPDMIVYRAANPNGQALLILPGGGYRYVVMDKEGFETAEWFARRGVTCFVLMYRLPLDGWSRRSDVPLMDAQRAMRLVRGHAQEFGYEPDRIGVLGFSAGGHLAASLATMFARDVYAPGDAADDLSARPDFAILMYPVISMDPAIAHAGSRENLLGPDAGVEQERRYSIELNVTTDTPPVLLLHAADDEVVVVDNSLRLYDALRRAGVRVDLHVFSQGGHGFGLRNATDKPVAAWPELVLRWMQQPL